MIKHLAFTQQFRVDELQQPRVDSLIVSTTRHDASEGTTLCNKPPLLSVAIRETKCKSFCFILVTSLQSAPKQTGAIPDDSNVGDVLALHG